MLIALTIRDRLVTQVQSVDGKIPALAVRVSSCIRQNHTLFTHVVSVRGILWTYGPEG